MSNPRFGLVIGVALRICVFLAGAYALMKATPEASRDLVIIPLVIVLPVMLPLMWTVQHWKIMRRLARGTRPIRKDSPMLAHYGVRRVNILLLLNGRHVGWCYRRGRSAWITVAPFTSDPAAFQFVIAHESGHAIRDDSTRRRVGLSVCVALLYGAAFSFDYWLILTTLVAIVAGWTMTVWIAEIACDRIAVQRMGIEAMESFATAVRDLLRVPANRTPRRRIRRFFGLLGHPPLSWRVALQRRTRPLLSATAASVVTASGAAASAVAASGVAASGVAVGTLIPTGPAEA